MLRRVRRSRLTASGHRPVRATHLRTGDLLLPGARLGRWHLRSWSRPRGKAIEGGAIETIATRRRSSEREEALHLAGFAVPLERSDCLQGHFRVSEPRSIERVGEATAQVVDIERRSRDGGNVDPMIRLSNLVVDDIG